MQGKNKEYFKVYDFTNENVACLKDLYYLEGANVLSVIGSGDQYFSSMLNGAKKVELFDINPTSELYMLLKFFAIRELTYEEFFNYFIKKNFTDIAIYNKLEHVLPLEVIKYLKFLICNNRNKVCFRKDGIKILSKKNKKYYFDINNQVIPYILEDNYYKLKEILQKTPIPKVYNNNILEIKEKIKGNYDVLLLSNIYDSLRFNLDVFTDLLNSFNIPEIQACYDWMGRHYGKFKLGGYAVDLIYPSSPEEFGESYNYVYSLKK